MAVEPGKATGNPAFPGVYGLLALYWLLVALCAAIGYFDLHWTFIGACAFWYAAAQSYADDASNGRPDLSSRVLTGVVNVVALWVGGGMAYVAGLVVGGN